MAFFCSRVCQTISPLPPSITNWKEHYLATFIFIDEVITYRFLLIPRNGPFKKWGKLVGNSTPPEPYLGYRLRQWMEFVFSNCVIPWVDCCVLLLPRERSRAGVRPLLLYYFVPSLSGAPPGFSLIISLSPEWTGFVLFFIFISFFIISFSTPPAVFKRDCHSSPGQICSVYRTVW